MAIPVSSRHRCQYVKRAPCRWRSPLIVCSIAPRANERQDVFRGKCVRFCDTFFFGCRWRCIYVQNSIVACEEDHYELVDTDSGLLLCWMAQTITAFKFILFACRKGGSYKRA